MPTCEKCSVTFEQPDDLTEVASLRVLCPRCMAEHRARRASRAQKDVVAPAQRPSAAGPGRVPPRASGTGPAPAAASERPAESRLPAELRPRPERPAAPKGAGDPATPPSAGQRPTPRSSAGADGPPRRAAANAASAGKPASAGKSANAAKPPSAAQPTNAAKAPRAGAADRRAAPARSAPPAAKTAGGGKPSSARATGASPAARRKKSSIDLDSLPSRNLKKRGSREVIIGFVLAFVVMGVAGVTLFRAVEKNRREAAEREARLAEIEAFRSEFMAIDMSTEEGAKRLIAFSEENREQWADQEFAGEVVTRTAKAKTLIEGEAEKRELQGRLASVEAEVARASELEPAALAEQRRRLEELAPKGPVVGPDFVARLARAREAAESAYLGRLIEEAQEASAMPALDRAALARVQQAEDEVLKVYEAAYRAWQKDAQNPELSARKQELEERYKALIELSDQTVTRFFTPEVIASTPWRNLLDAEHAGQWRGASLAGFEYRIADGVLHMIGPDPAEKSEGVISIGDREAWRNYVIEAEVTVVRGQASLFFRLPPVWQENVELFDLTTDESLDGALEPGRPYTVTFRLIGSSFTHEIVEHGIGPIEDHLSWTKVRKGALGISIPKNSEIKFTRLQIKILR